MKIILKENEVRYSYHKFESIKGADADSKIRISNQTIADLNNTIESLKGRTHETNFALFDFVICSFEVYLYEENFHMITPSLLRKLTIYR